MENIHFDTFETGYAGAILDTRGYWPQEDEDIMAEWENVDLDSFSNASMSRIRRDCAAFKELLSVGESGRTLFDELIELCGYDEEYAGFAFFVARQGAVCFSERFPGETGEALDSVVLQIGEAYVEVGGNGEIAYG